MEENKKNTFNQHTTKIKLLIDGYLDGPSTNKKQHQACVAGTRVLEHVRRGRVQGKSKRRSCKFGKSRATTAFAPTKNRREQQGERDQAQGRDSGDRKTQHRQECSGTSAERHTYTSVRVPMCLPKVQTRADQRLCPKGGPEDFREKEVRRRQERTERSVKGICEKRNTKGRLVRGWLR